jgi:hypothetical protein
VSVSLYAGTSHRAAHPTRVGLGRLLCSQQLALADHLSKRLANGNGVRASGRLRFDPRYEAHYLGEPVGEFEGSDARVLALLYPSPKTLK